MGEIAYKQTAGYARILLNPARAAGCSADPPTEHLPPESPNPQTFTSPYKPYIKFYIDIYILIDYIGRRGNDSGIRIASLFGGRN
jgi:hypothetical protein